MYLPRRPQDPTVDSPDTTSAKMHEDPGLHFTGIYHSVNIAEDTNSKEVVCKTTVNRRTWSNGLGGKLSFYYY